MTTNILLARHGQTDSNVSGFFMGWSDEDINGVGHSQAQRLSARLAGLPIAAFYASPLQRTRTTAAILAEPHHLEPVVLDDLAEIRLGDWEGLYMEEISRRWPELWRQSRKDPSEISLPNGESFPQVTERAVRTFEQVAGANEGRQAVIVTHDIIIRLIVAHVLGVSNRIYRLIEIGNASLSEVRLQDGTARLIRLNGTAHLENDGTG